ncbi:tRNA (guanosine(37)-N1)-methyltransferase TrmD [Aquipuribacter nitratireducens]|uniref:tRNA (guanine-N(1)-)-methyltransferase n=1 Tax=Aquipuribacter nitratireducens TaxID=650104 RepID=A0ABW0GPF5_9MICO
MRVDVVSVFPDYLEPLRLSLIGRAVARGRLRLGVHDLRAFTHDVHRTVDDAPFGGGAGMLMTPPPWGEALDHVRAEGRAQLGEHVEPHLLVMSPAGVRFDQAMAEDLAREPWLVLACGRYEGIDDRVLTDAARHHRVTPVSIGDYVLAGGEAAALVVVEAVGRLLPGVLGNSASVVEESHSEGLLEAPAYTRPASWRGLDVPDVLTSGDHARVARWRRDESLRRTAARRPDLLGGRSAADLDRHDLAVLAELGWDVVDGVLARAR